MTSREADIVERLREIRQFYNDRPAIDQEKQFPDLAEISVRECSEGNSKRHCELIRLLPCCVTGQNPGGTIHHLKTGPAAKERGVGMRATDKWGVPLSWDSHINGVERVGSRQELAWFRARGIEDPYELAAALWRASPNFEAMKAVLAAHMNPKVKP